MCIFAPEWGVLRGRNGFYTETSIVIRKQTPRACEKSMGERSSQGSRHSATREHTGGRTGAAPTEKKGRSELELSKFEEVTGAGGDFAALQFAEALWTKLLDGEATEDGAVDHRTAKRGVIRTAAAGKVSHEAAGKRVACACRIMRLFERKW